MIIKRNITTGHYVIDLSVEEFEYLACILDNGSSVVDMTFAFYEWCRFSATKIYKKLDNI